MKVFIKLTLIFLIFPAVAIAAEYTKESQFLKDVPAPISGVEIVSPTKMLLTNQVNSNSSLKLKQQNKIGYVNSNTPNANNLLKINKQANDEINQYKNTKDIYDTHLKRDLSDIKLAFSYKSPSSVLKSNRIGYAPIGTIVESKWTGIKEFFNDKQLGVCSLSVYHIKLSNMGIRMNAEAVSYVVSNYPTTKSVQGNPKDGFMYMLTWISPVFVKDLECASVKLEANKMKQMIAFANQLEND